MKIFFPLSLLVVAACSSSSTKDAVATDTTTRSNTIDSSVVASATTRDIPSEQFQRPATDMQVALEYFIKNPFISNHAEIKQSLRDGEIPFKDELVGPDSVLSFASSRIAFLVASQEVIDAGLGDLICSADISEAKFVFNSHVAVGMDQSRFLELFGLQADALTKDANGNIYFESEIPFDGGHWKITLFFVKEKLARFLYEITPCEYDLSD